MDELKQERIIKITIDIIKSLIELFNSGDEDNYLIAYNMINSIDFNLKKKRHVFYIEMLWYIYTGEYSIPSSHKAYEAQKIFYEYLDDNGFLNRNMESFHDNKLTKNFKQKFKRFYKKYDPNFRVERLEWIF